MQLLTFIRCTLDAVRMISKDRRHYSISSYLERQKRQCLVSPSHIQLRKSHAELSFKKLKINYALIGRTSYKSAIKMNLGYFDCSPCLIQHAALFAPMYRMPGVPVYYISYDYSFYVYRELMINLTSINI